MELSISKHAVMVKATITPATKTLILRSDVEAI